VTLLRLAERDGERGPRGMTLHDHLTRQSPADMTGTTFETTIRVVSRWQKNRPVRDEGGCLILANPDAIRTIAAAQPE